MNGELGKPGYEAVGDVPWGTHVCLFSRTVRDLLEILVSHFVAGLRANEVCSWITSEPRDMEAAQRAVRPLLRLNPGRRPGKKGSSRRS